MTSERQGRAGLLTGLAIGIGLWASAGTASAQLLGGGCGPDGCSTAGCATGNCDGKTGLFGPTSGWKGPYGLCGLRIYPIFDKRYIRQFTCPTVDPNSCFGYHQTRWTQWNEACPNFVAGNPAAVNAVSTQPVPASPTIQPVPTAPPPKPLTETNPKSGVEKGMGLPTIPTIPTIPQVPFRAPAPIPVRAGG